MSSAITLPTSGPRASASAPVPAPESRTRSLPANGTNWRSSSRSVSRRARSRSTMRAAVRANRSCTASACVSSDKVERLLSGGDRACRPLLGDQLQQRPDLRARPAGRARRRGAAARQGRPRATRRARRRDRADRGRRGRRVAHGSVERRKRCNDARRRVGRRRAAQQRDGVAAELARDRQQAERVLEEDDQPVVGRVDGAGALDELERASERRQEPELVEALASRGRPAGAAPRGSARRPAS